MGQPWRDWRTCWQRDEGALFSQGSERRGPGDGGRGVREAFLECGEV